MATVIKTLRDWVGNQIIPRTRTIAVFDDANVDLKTTLENNVNLNTVDKSVIGAINELELNKAEQTDLDTTNVLVDEIKSSLGWASGYNVDESIGANDATALLNTYFSDLKSSGLNTAVFDKQHTYKVVTALTEAYGTILKGNAEIESSTTLNGNVNYYLGVNNSEKQFNGKINSEPYKEESFKQFRKALTENRNIKVTVFGDSISTNGGDRLNLSRTSGTGTLLSANGISNSDTYINGLINELTTNFPNKVFDFYDRAIGGEILDSWNTTKTFNGVTKTWIEHIKDTNPDLLIVSFGMNHDTYPNSLSFSYKLKQLLDYIETNFTVKPDIAIVTVPRSTYVPGLVEYGSVQGQETRQNAADSARFYGLQRGCYIIDVNRISNIKRTGNDFSNPIFKKVSNYYDYVGLTGATEIGTHQWQIKNLNDFLNINKSLKSFSFYSQLQFDTIAVDEAVSIHFNWLSGTSNTIKITPNSSENSNNTTIRNYTNIADGGNWGTTAKIYNHSSQLSTVKIRIQKKNDILEISLVDGATGIGTVIIRDKMNVWNANGEIVVMKTNGSTMSCKILDMELLEDSYQQYLPTLTDNQMFGDYVTGDYNTKLPYGGNGVNHPSSIGLSECYVPAIQEFVKDLVNVSSVKQIKDTTYATTMQNGWGGSLNFVKNEKEQISVKGTIVVGTLTQGIIVGNVPLEVRSDLGIPIVVYNSSNGTIVNALELETNGDLVLRANTNMATGNNIRINMVYQK